MNKINLVIGLVLSLIVIGSVFLLISYSDTWFINQFEAKGIYESVEKEEADRTISEILDFISFKSNSIPSLTEKEFSHMEDVRKIYAFLFRFLVLSILVFFSFIFYQYYYKKFDCGEILKFGGISILAFIVIVGLPFIIDFNSSFYYFHKIFFPQGNWSFDPENFIITRILSEEIFFSFVKLFVGLLLFFSSLFLIIYRIISRTFIKKDSSQDL